MKRFVVISLCLLVMIAGLSPAGAEETKKNYVLGKFGVFFPSSGSVDNFDDAGFNGEFALGRYIARNLAIELGVGAYGLSGDEFIGNTVYTGFYSADDTISVVPLTLSLKAIFPLTQKLEAYVIGGIGAYFIYFEREFNSVNLGEFDYNDDHAVFGGHVGGGAVYNITNRFFAGGELKYNIVPSVDFSPLGATKGFNMSGAVLTANVGFRF